MEKLLMMIAGPNGAGKNNNNFCSYRNQRQMYKEFLNADEIARGLLLYILKV